MNYKTGPTHNEENIAGYLPHSHVLSTTVYCPFPIVRMIIQEQQKLSRPRDDLKLPHGSKLSDIAREWSVTADVVVASASTILVGQLQFREDQNILFAGYVWIHSYFF